MDVKADYKPTEARTIPQNWDLRPLGTIGRWFSGTTPSMSNRAYWYGDIPWVSPKDMKVSRLFGAIDHITAKAVTDGAKVLPIGAILVVTRGMILAHTFPVARAERPLAFNQDIKAVVSVDDIDSTFLLYWLTANSKRLLSLTTESTHGTKRLPTEMLFRELVSCPPTIEQEAIADALRDVDDLVESLEYLLAKRYQIKNGAMQELLTGKKRLPGFSGEWGVKVLGDVATLQRGFDLPHRMRMRGSFPIVTSSGIEDTHCEAKIRGPGVVTGRYGTIGEVFYVPGDFWPLNTTLYVRDFHGHDPRFISYLLRTIDFHTHSGKSGVPGVNRNDLHQIEVPLPPTNAEEEAIAEVLSDADALVESLEQLLAKKRHLKQGMMQKLLTGTIRLV
jgi:type I restriction enzyme S subunit